MENAPAVYEGTAVVNFEDYAMNVGSLVKQITLIQDAMQKVMRENEHYGKIPGTPKPTLLKPGAEKLCLMFRLDPDYDIIREVREEYFIAYTVKCLLTHIPTGQRIGSGIGSCNSRETKYRFRHDSQMTDTEVPKAYWDAKNAGNSQEMKRILGEGNRAKKNEETGKWVIARSVQVENDNPWDLDNTIIKMACKRALVAATLNATAASDIFTQDIEDMPQGTVQGNARTTQKKEPVKQPQEKAPEKSNGDLASEAQVKAISTMYGKLGFDEKMKYAYCSEAAGLTEVIKSTKDLTKAQASAVIDKLNRDIEEKKAVEG